MVLVPVWGLVVLVLHPLTPFGLVRLSGRTAALLGAVLLHAGGTILVVLPAVLAHQLDALVVRSRGPALLMSAVGVLVSTLLVRRLARTADPVTAAPLPPRPMKRSAAPGTRPSGPKHPEAMTEATLDALPAGEGRPKRRKRSTTCRRS